MSNFFSTCTIMIARQPANVNGECLTADADYRNTVEKVHDFFHLRLKVPVVWLVGENMLAPYGERFRSWRQEYGDEFGIYELGMAGSEFDPGLWQEWIEKGGFKRPVITDGPPYKTWGDLPEETQVACMRYLKGCYDQALDQDTKLIYAPYGNASTVRAMKTAGLSILWGYNWGLYGDGVDATGKGCLPGPFYVSDVHAKVPAHEGDRSVFGFPWGGASFVNAYCSSRMAKIALNDVCLNPHELANRSPRELAGGAHSGSSDRIEFVDRLIAEYAAQTAWNPFVLLPLQIEAYWLDESEFAYGQHPHFNPRTTELFFHEVEAALRQGAKIVTCEQFMAWYRERFARTPELLWHSEDLLKGVRIRGKDHDYSPMLIYGDHSRQDIFLKEQGFNPVRHYSYATVEAAADPCLEYPFKAEPRVELKVKEWTTPQMGIVLGPEGAAYEVRQHDLTAYDDEPDYSFVLWEANIPDYVGLEDLQLSPNIKRVRLLREKNIALVFAPLVKGANMIAIASAKPGQFIRIEEVRLSGRRYEIYLRNDGPPVALCSLRARIGAGLKVGGFWWDGRYHETLYEYHYSPYNWRTGDLNLNTAYPFSLPLRSGITRCSIEIVGTIGSDVAKITETAITT